MVYFRPQYTERRKYIYRDVKIEMLPCSQMYPPRTCSMKVTTSAYEEMKITVWWELHGKRLQCMDGWREHGETTNIHPKPLPANAGVDVVTSFSTSVSL